MKYSIQKLTIATFILFLLLGINSCEKENEKAPLQKNKHNTNEKILFLLKGQKKEHILTAQKWIGKKYPQTRASNDFHPMWQYAFNDSLKTSHTVEVPLSHIRQRCFVLPENQSKYEATNDGRYLQNITRLIVESNTEINGTRAYYMTIVPSAEYLEKNNFLIPSTNTYFDRDSSFDGYIIYSGIEGNAINGWIYKNGKIIHEIYPAEKTSTRSGTYTCIPTYTVEYIEWTYSNNDDVNYTINSIDIEWECWSDSEPSNSGGGMGGGGLSGSNNGGVGPVDYEINSYEIIPGESLDKYPEIKEIYECIIANANGVTQQWLSRFIGTEAPFNVTFKIGTADNGNANGYCDFTTDIYNGEIVLNKDRIGRSSLEIIRTLMHESMHAYMHAYVYSKYSGDDKYGKSTFDEAFDKFQKEIKREHPYLGEEAEHKYMAETWIKTMAEELHRLHQTQTENYNFVWENVDISDNDKKLFYEGMAWRGLENTEAYNALAYKNNMNKIFATYNYALDKKWNCK